MNLSIDLSKVFSISSGKKQAGSSPFDLWVLTHSQQTPLWEHVVQEQLQDWRFEPLVSQCIKEHSILIKKALDIQ
ncbi:MAG: hypothetical protein HXS53_13325 [Theionarchaea archaeon]|nr:hypothetical protein [Theionarchaea archaeon]